jgi:hypothetical protein
MHVNPRHRSNPLARRLARTLPLLLLLAGCTTSPHPAPSGTPVSPPVTVPPPVSETSNTPKPAPPANAPLPAKSPATKPGKPAPTKGPRFIGTWNASLFQVVIRKDGTFESLGPHGLFKGQWKETHGSIYVKPETGVPKGWKWFVSRDGKTLMLQEILGPRKLGRLSSYLKEE